MTLDPGVVRTLQFRISAYFSIADGFLHTALVVSTTKGAVLLDLLQTVGAVEEAPTQEVETTTELTTELLRTLYVGNLLKELTSVMNSFVSLLAVPLPMAMASIW